MKSNHFYFLAVVVLCMTLVACENQTQAEKEVNDVSDKLEQVGEQIADAFNKDRNEVQSAWQNMGEEVKGKLQELNEKLETASEDSKEAIQEQIDKLKTVQANIDSELSQIGKTAENEWDEVKANSQKAMTEMQKEWNDFVGTE